MFKLTQCDKRGEVTAGLKIALFLPQRGKKSIYFQKTSSFLAKPLPFL